MADPGSAATDGIGDVGIDHFGMGQPDLALAACGGCDRVDRKLVLFHPPGPEPEIARGPAWGRAGRSLAGPWRRLLPDHEIPGGPGQHAHRPDLVQMGSLHDLALGLRSD